MVFPAVVAAVVRAGRDAFLMAGDAVASGFAIDARTGDRAGSGGGLGTDAGIVRGGAEEGGGGGG